MVGPPTASLVAVPVKGFSGDVRIRFAERVTDPFPFSFLELGLDWGLYGPVAQLFI